MHLVLQAYKFGVKNTSSVFFTIFELLLLPYNATKIAKVNIFN